MVNIDLNKPGNTDEDRTDVEKVTSDGIAYQISFNEGRKYIRVNGIRTEMPILNIPQKIEDINVEVVKKGAFMDDKSIEEVYIPESVRLVGAEAFKNCVSLRKVQLPARLETINQSCFEGCESLNDIKLPDGLARVCHNAFYNCTALTKVVIENSEVSIAKDAFDKTVAIVHYTGALSFVRYSLGKVFGKNHHSTNNEKYIKQLTERTGWNREKAIESLNKAAAMGITNYQYVSKYVFQLTEDEQAEFASLLKLLEEKKKKDNNFYISEVCRQSGWSRKKAISEMEKAKETGVSYLKYVQKAYWSKKNEKVKERLVKSILIDKERIATNKKTYVEKIREKTGWSIGKVQLEVMRAKVNCDASYEDFYVFKLYEKTAEEQKKYITLGLFQKMRIKYNDHMKAWKTFDNKVEFNTMFADLIKHKWFFNRDISYDEFLSKIEGLTKLIVKPLTATQGKGIQVFSCNISDEDNKKLYDNIMNLGKSIVEEYIIQNKEIAKFCATSVNTVRVMTLNYENQCKFLHSVFRMGNGGVVDNFHAGGVAAAVDLETGIIYTNATDLDGNVFTESPATGIPIKGFQIPYWNDVIELCEKATGRVEGVNLIGWDLAITDNGVDLVEGNPGASYVVAQIPNVEDNIGLADVMALPYL